MYRLLQDVRRRFSAGVVDLGADVFSDMDESERTIADVAAAIQRRPGPWDGVRARPCSARPRSRAHWTRLLRSRARDRRLPRGRDVRSGNVDGRWYAHK